MQVILINELAATPGAGQELGGYLAFNCPTKYIRTSARHTNSDKRPELFALSIGQAFPFVNAKRLSTALGRGYGPPAATTGPLPAGGEAAVAAGLVGVVVTLHRALAPPGPET
ncbi:hypothetical protein GCM10010486_20710 [Nonomuraea roseoviolacea subsp. carminata]